MEKGELGRGASMAWRQHRRNMIVELARQGDSDGVRRESDAGKSIHVTDDEGRTPLIRASMKGHKDTVEVVLGLLHASSNMQGNPRVRDSINAKDLYGNTALLVASRGGRPTDRLNYYQIVKMLLEEKDGDGCLVRINEKNKLGSTALMWACEYGHRDLAELLLDHGASIDEKDKYGNTALLGSSMNYFTDVVELLLKRRANVDLKNKEAVLVIPASYLPGHLLEAVVNGEVIIFQPPVGSKPGATVPITSMTRAKDVDLKKTEVIKNNEVELKDNDTALIVASRERNEGVVKLLLDGRANPALLNLEGHTALIESSVHGFEDVTKLLIDGKAQVDQQEDKTGLTALIGACVHGKTGVAKLLLDGKARVDQQEDKKGHTALIGACVHGFTDVAELLLDRGASIDLKDKRGNTALILASGDGNEAVARLLLNKGAEINMQNKAGRTALIMACKKGRKRGGWAEGLEQEKMVKSLSVSRWLSSSRMRNRNKLSEWLAIWRYNWEATVRAAAQTVMVVLLLGRGASVNMKDKDGYTALMWASVNGYKSVVVRGQLLYESVAKQLLNRGASTDEKNKNGHTALMMACMHGHKEVAEALLDRKAQPDVQTEDGRTALMVASEYGHTEVAELLLDRGAYDDRTDVNGCTALMVASEHRNKDVVELLLDRGAQADLEDNEGNTALVWAKEEQKPTLYGRRSGARASNEVEVLLLEYDVDIEFVAGYARMDEDALGRMVANVSVSPDEKPKDIPLAVLSSSVLEIIELAAVASREARYMRSFDSRGADKRETLNAQLQLAVAALLSEIPNPRARVLLENEDGQKALQKAGDMRAKMLFTQPVVQDYVTAKWRKLFDNAPDPGFNSDFIVGWTVVTLFLVLQVVFLLPIVALAPPLDPILRRKFPLAYVVDAPVVKFYLETVSDVAFAVVLTAVPSEALGGYPAAPILLAWVVAGLYWELKSLDVVKILTGNIAEGLRPYVSDPFNLLDTTAMAFTAAAVLTAIDERDNYAVATTLSAPILHAYAVLLLWIRTMRGLLMSHTWFPYISMFFKMLLGDFLKFLVLLVVVIVGFGAAWSKVLGSVDGSASAHACLEDFYTREYGWYSPYMQMLEDAVSGATDGFFECAHEMGVARGAWTLTILFCVVVVLILLNMLIAMMSESFSQIWSQRDVDYTFSTSRRTFSLIEQPPTPPPFCALSLPHAAISTMQKLFERLLGRKVKSPRVLPSPSELSRLSSSSSRRRRSSVTSERAPSPPLSPPESDEETPTEAAPADALPEEVLPEEVLPEEAANVEASTEQATEEVASSESSSPSFSRRRRQEARVVKAFASTATGAREANEVKERAREDKAKAQKRLEQRKEALKERAAAVTKYIKDHEHDDV